MTTERKNIDIYFSRSGKGYKIAVQNQDGGGERDRDFSLSVEEITGTIHELRLARAREAREIDVKSINFNSEQSKIETLGKKFFKELSSCLENFLPSPRNNSGKVRLRFRFNKDVPELAKWPWEYLYNHVHLSLQKHTPIIRYIEYGNPARNIETELPLKILFVAANSPKHRELNLKKELDEIKKVLKKFAKEVTWDILLGQEATKEQLNQKLDQESYHVLHFMGHGTFNSDEKEGYLQLFDNPLEDEVLKTWIANHHSLKMVFLNACRGAQSDSEDIFTGMAHNITALR